MDGGLGTSRPTLLYFVMEFIEGTDVAHLVAAQGQLPPQEAIRITTAVCDALAYAHARGVVHRDIKPSNIMIDADGQVKVADFGLAKITAQDSGGLTKSSVAMGTPDFIAPEAMLAGALVDQRADIYAVGVMLYQMLTGHIPRGRFSPISAVVPQSDPKLDAIVDKAMQTDREKRYSSAVEMKTEVESVAAPARAWSGSAPGDTPPDHRLTAAATRRRVSLIVAVAVLVLAAGAFFMLRDKTGAVANPAALNIPPQSKTPLPPLPETGWKPLISNLQSLQGLRGITVKKDGWLELNRARLPITVREHDAAIRAHIRLPDETRSASLVLRNTSDKTGGDPTTDQDTTTEYIVTLSPTARDLVRVVFRDKRFQSQETELAKMQLPRKMAAGESIPLAAAVKGTELVVYFDGQPIGRVPQSTLPGAGLTIWAVSGSAEFKDIEWVSLAEPATASDVSPNVWRLPDGPPGLVKELEADGNVRGLTMMPDGRRVMSKSDVSQGTSTMIQIIQWDVETGKRLWVREFPTGHSLDNPMILLNGDASMAMLQRTPELSLIFLDSKNGSTQRRLPIQGTPLATKNVPVRCQMGASPDGKRLAVAMFKASPSDFEPVCLQVFDAATQSPAGQWTLGSQVRSIYAMDWLDGDRVIVALNEVDKELPVAESRQSIVDVSHPENKVQQVKQTRSFFDHFLAAIPGMPDHVITHNEGNVVICDVAQARVVRTWPGTLTQRFFAFPNERTVLGLAENPTRSNPVTLWELPTGREIGTLSDPRIHDILALSPDGSYVVTNELEPDSGSARRLSSRMIGVWRLPKLPANVMPDQKKSAAAPSWPHLPTEAEKKLAFTNSLGMKFMPVPGTDVLFCIHETRKQDYAAYTAETPGVDMTWKQPSIYHDLPVGAGEDHPVTQINLADCQGFCAWLSAREGRRYRLPTDLEWSWAVGIGDREDASALPEKRGGGAGSVYAWGTEWPPPPRVANIADESLRQVAAHVPNRLIPGYDDGFATTAPVMSFPPNALGIYDLAGNVWELIPDWMDAEKQDVLRRGSSFNNGSLDPARAYVAANVRNPRPPGMRSEDGGFRIVVEKP